ncbi:polycomb group RING finger protein 5-A-like isoform X2 [Rhopilema esculentum]|uniref:polycomb group RING finger protein 5-A-like isoform X2 n=1 Tax=Rhopilema esculentum TaxID=499914 RepID=UPI0031D2EB5E|eukprot:gene6747-12311_t
MSVLHPKGKRYLNAASFNNIFICKLCRGYLIKPVAITECLHTFCKSCLVRYLESATESFRCPDCHQQIHETNPWEYLREDKTLEEIIFKLVPGLWKNERQRISEFYHKRGLPIPEDFDFQTLLEPSSPTSEIVNKNSNDCDEESKENNNQKARHFNKNLIGDTQIGLQLKYLETNDIKKDFRQLDKSFIRCSSYLTVDHLKKFLKMKLKLPDTSEVDILCNGEIMGKHHTLEFIYMTRWRFTDSLLSLDYRPKVDFNEA